MKKIFTLIAVFLTLAGTSAHAQSFEIYSNGEKVDNGATVHVKGVHHYMDYEGEIIGEYYDWRPEIVAKGNKYGTVELTFNGPGWYLCWPANCVPAVNNVMKSEGTLSMDGSDLMIHSEIEVYLGDTFEMPEDYKATVVIKSGDDVFTMYLINDKPEESGVGNITVNDAAPTYYNLQGQKVVNPENGIYIKVANGKSTKVVK